MSHVTMGITELLPVLHGPEIYSYDLLALLLMVHREKSLINQVFMLSPCFLVKIKQLVKERTAFYCLTWSDFCHERAVACVFRRTYRLNDYMFRDTRGLTD